MKEKERFQAEDKDGNRYIIIRYGPGYVEAPHMGDTSEVIHSDQSLLITSDGDPVSLNDDGAYKIIGVEVTVTRIIE